MRTLFNILVTIVAVLTATIGSLPWVLCESAAHGVAVEIASAGHGEVLPTSTGQGHRHIVTVGEEPQFIITSECRDTPLTPTVVMARRVSDAANCVGLGSSGHNPHPVAAAVNDPDQGLRPRQNIRSSHQWDFTHVRSHLTDLHTIILMI